MDNTGIEWTDSTWNPVRGCARVSEGCRNCYAESIAARFSGPGKPYEGLIHPKTRGWNGKVRLVPEALQIPWRWSRGRRIFVNSMSDLFHEDVPFEFIAAVFFVMAHTTRHTYQILTKRPARMLEFFEWAREDDTGVWEAERISEVGGEHPAVKALGWEPWREGKRHGGYDNCGPGFPYENVWIGVSVEDQVAADERIPLLLQTPAAVRFLSCEPLLGPLSLRWLPAFDGNAIKPRERGESTDHLDGLRKLDWVIAGGESGHGARPMHPDWARKLRDECSAASVPFFFKQWGEWLPRSQNPMGIGGAKERVRTHFWNDGITTGAESATEHVGKKKAGRLLDGREHSESRHETREGMRVAGAASIAGLREGLPV